MNTETYPLGSKIRFEFPARKTSFPPRIKRFFIATTARSRTPARSPGMTADKPDPSGAKRPRLQQQAAEGVAGPTSRICMGEVPNSACLLIGDEGQNLFARRLRRTVLHQTHGRGKKFVHYKKYPDVGQTSRRPFRATISRATAISSIIWNGSRRSRRASRKTATRDSRSPRNSRKSCCSAASRCARARRLEWDGPNMVAKNCPEAAPFIKRDNRVPWALA